MISTLSRICFFVGLSTGFLTPELPDSFLEAHTGEAVFDSHSSLASAPPCNDNNLKTCQSVFNSAIGISSSIDWTNPALFHQSLLHIYYTSKTLGVTQVCNAYTKFSQCLGSTYSSCINTRHFIQQGLPLQKASFYPTILTQLHFQCGGGLQSLLPKFDCISNIDITMNQTLVNCNRQYLQNVSANPQNACKYSSMLLNCVRQPYTVCGTQSAWFSCEYTRVAVNVNVPSCPITCTANGAQIKMVQSVSAEGPEPKDPSQALSQINLGDDIDNIYSEIAIHAPEANES